jgi:hypothetical protein
MTPGCFRPGFQVVCNHSFVPPRAFLDYNGGATYQQSYTYTVTAGSPADYGSGAVVAKGGSSSWTCPWPRARRGCALR